MYLLMGITVLLLEELLVELRIYTGLRRMVFMGLRPGLACCGIIISTEMGAGSNG